MQSVIVKYLCFKASKLAEINISLFLKSKFEFNRIVLTGHFFLSNIELYLKCTLFCFCVVVYSPDMPTHLPIKDFISGLARNILRAVRYWLHYTLVAIAWLGVVPITACKSS